MLYIILNHIVQDWLTYGLVLSHLKNTDHGKNMKILVVEATSK